MIKVYLDEYNSMGGSGEAPSGVGDYINLVPWDLVKDTDWEACSYGKDYSPKTAVISDQDYARFRDACKTIHDVIDKVYLQQESFYDD